MTPRLGKGKNKTTKVSSTTRVYDRKEDVYRNTKTYERKKNSNIQIKRLRTDPVLVSERIEALPVQLPEPEILNIFLNKIFPRPYPYPKTGSHPNKVDSYHKRVITSLICLYE